MRKWSKVCIILLVLGLAISLCACGSDVGSASGSLPSVGAPSVSDFQEVDNDQQSESDTSDDDGTQFDDSYYELNISLDDLKIAGYSVKDGNKMEEIYQEAVNELPAYDGGNTGWNYQPALFEPGRLYIQYATYSTNICMISYTVEDLTWFDKTRPTLVYIRYNLGDSRVPTDSYPLLSYVVPPMTPFSEVVEYYGLEELIQCAVSAGGETSSYSSLVKYSYDFKSQYGDTTITVSGNAVDSGESISELVISNNSDSFGPLAPGGVSFNMKFEGNLLVDMTVCCAADIEYFDRVEFNRLHGVD